MTPTALRRDSRAFTLIELMIVVAIIGILASIAIPKFAELIRKTNEGATKGSLGVIRAALSIYYGDMEGQFPSDMNSLTISGKYLNAMPPAKAANYHVPMTNVANAAAAPAEDGGWHYNNGAAAIGDAHVNCTHTDTKGTTWTAY